MTKNKRIENFQTVDVFVLHKAFLMTERVLIAENAIIHAKVVMAHFLIIA